MRQRLIVELLSRDQQTITEGLPIGELRLALAGTDRANRRRVIRLLIARGVVEEVGDSSETSGKLVVLRLSFSEQLVALWRVNPPNYYHDTDTYERETPCKPGHPMY